MDGCSLVNITELPSITFGTKVIWRIFKLRRLFLWALIWEVRLLIQVSVPVFIVFGFFFSHKLTVSFVRLISSFGNGGFRAINHQDAREDRENLLWACRCTLEIYLWIFEAQQLLDGTTKASESQPQYDPVIIRDSMWVCEDWSRLFFFFFNQSTIIQKRAQGGALIILPCVSWLPTCLSFTSALCSLKWNLLRPQNRILRRRAAHYSTWDCVISSLIAGARECSNPLIQSDPLNCLFGLDQTRCRIVRQLGSDWLPQPVRPWKK